MILAKVGLALSYPTQGVRLGNWEKLEREGILYFMVILDELCLGLWKADKVLYFFYLLFTLLSIYLAIQLSSYPSIRLSIYTAIHLSSYPTIQLSNYPTSISLFLYSSIPLFLYPSIQLSSYPAIPLSLYLSIFLSLYSSIHLSIYPVIHISFSFALDLPQTAGQCRVKLIPTVPHTLY